jgi:hypothetical protein
VIAGSTGGNEGSIAMLQTLRKTLMLSSKDSLAKAFSRLGWIGLWIQLVIGSILVLLAIYALIFIGSGGAGTRGGSLVIEYLSILGLIVLVFTTIWSYRYTRLGAQIAVSCTAPIGIRGAASGLDRNCRKRSGHSFFDARPVVRGGAASALFPPLPKPAYPWFRLRDVDRRVGFPQQI